MSLTADPRVRAVPWRDLVTLAPVERLRELLLPLPWLVVELVAAEHRLWPIALAAAFYFFLSGLRLVHDTFHGSLGLGGRSNDGILVLLSALMLSSMDAVRLTHLRHHRACLGTEDVEGAVARGSARTALLGGALFPVRLHVAAWRLANRRQRGWILAELALCATCLAGALASRQAPLTIHVCAMAVGQTFTGFFAVWTVHHDCDRWHQIARTLRHRLKSLIACNMFYHLEHHLYPRVPTCRLPILAGRLDQAVPDLDPKQVY
jgi:fatty acid desaturase